jgi:hypothetical protein
MSVELAFGDSVVHVGSEFPDMGILSPLTIGATATVLQINTDDADGLWTRALDAGAGARHELADAFWGATGSSPTRSVTGGTSPNDSATYPTTRSSPRQPRPSAAAETTILARACRARLRSRLALITAFIVALVRA